MLKKIKKSIIFLLTVALCAANFTFVSGATKKIHTPVPDIIKVYGAIDTNTTNIPVDTTIKNKDNTDKAYLKAYVYVESNNKVIGKGKYIGTFMYINIPKQKQGTQLKIYIKNGKSRTKTIYKVVVGDSDISTLKKSKDLKQPGAMYDYDTRTLDIVAQPKTKLTIKSYKKTLLTRTVPTSGKMKVKLPKAKYGETIWMYVSKNNVRSEFFIFNNSAIYYFPG